MLEDVVEKPGRRVNTFTDRFLHVVGRTLITTGLLLAAFVAYQIWGTGIEQSQSQEKLEQQYIEQIDPVVEPQAPLKLDSTVFTEGKTVGNISIPTLEVNEWLVMGVRDRDLKRGPGVFTTSALPGQLGNLAIAGHRTSYGAPFANIDKLKLDDNIIVATRYGTFTYKVTSSEIVSPNQVEVLNVKDPNKAVITLITCHPKRSTSKRLVVHASLISEQTPEKPTIVASIKTAEEPDFSTGWFHDPSRAVPTALWGALLIAIWVTGRTVFRRFRLQATSITSTRAKAWNTFGTIIAISTLAAEFIITLYLFFRNLTGLLPANI